MIRNIVWTYHFQGQMFLCGSPIHNPTCSDHSRHCLTMIYSNYDCIFDESEQDGLDYSVEEDVHIKEGHHIYYKTLTLKESSDSVDKTESKQMELIRWNNRLGHISFKSLKTMASQGIIQRSLQYVDTPVCAACIYSQQTKTPWRHKKKNTHKIGYNKTNNPGDFLSVDQIERKFPGYQGNMKGKHTRRRIRVSKVYVDHLSDITYLHLQHTTNSQETLESKQELESYASEFDIKIKHYHSDNGRFVDNLFKYHALKRIQTMSVEGVSSTHHNGKVEKVTVTSKIIQEP